MPFYCCVPGCKIKRGGHRFPKEADLLYKWRVAIKRIDPTTRKLWMLSMNDIVCSDNFTPDCFKETLTGTCKRLKPGTVPNVFKFDIPLTPSANRRQERAQRKRDLVPDEMAACLDVGNEVVVNTTEEGEGTPYTNDTRTSCVAVQCDLLSERLCLYSIERFQESPDTIKFYTGFDNYDHFMLFYQILGPAVNELSYQCRLIEPKNQLFLTLIKLRRAKEDTELGIMFGLSSTTVSKLVVIWINFMYFQLNEIDIWPSKEIVQTHMPVDFKKKFGSTRIILDATEVPIQKPSNVESQSSTFSTYKHKNTLKTMIGCTPGGFVSYVSDSYGGSTSDRQIIERSELCKDCNSHFEPFDHIMADRGIMVQDLFANMDVFVNTPTMLKGQSQLEPEKVVRDRRIASQRIHIERVIGLSKTFLILKQDLAQSKVPLGKKNNLFYVFHDQ